MENKLIKFRRELHQQPELSGQEYLTSKKIRSFIQEKTGSEGQTVAETGILYHFHFGKGPRILVRVDIDALPIKEVNDFAHRSVTRGVSHKCGHDGHTAIGVGLILKLQETPLKSGSVSVLFQPAEETGEGAQSVLKEPDFKPHTFDFAIALHNIPKSPLHQVIWKTGSFTPAVKSLILKFQGKTAHASEPYQGNNPALALSQLTQWASENENVNEDSKSFQLITPVFMELGSKDYGISAGSGEVHFTLRSWEQERLDKTISEVIDEAQGIAEKHQLKLEHRALAEFGANQNDQKVVEAIVLAGKKLNLDISKKEKPFPWGEDFGIISQRIPGAMFGLGAGLDTPALHNPNYDFPDALISTGINMFYETARNLIDNEG